VVEEFSPGTFKSMTKRSHSRLKFTRKQFWYMVLHYELVNPTIKSVYTQGDRNFPDWRGQKYKRHPKVFLQTKTFQKFHQKFAAGFEFLRSARGSRRMQSEAVVPSHVMSTPAKTIRHLLDSDSLRCGPLGLGIFQTNADSRWKPEQIPGSQRNSSIFLVWKRNDFSVVL